MNCGKVKYFVVVYDDDVDLIVVVVYDVLVAVDDYDVVVVVVDVDVLDNVGVGAVVVKKIYLKTMNQESILVGLSYQTLFFLVLQFPLLSSSVCYILKKSI